MSVLKEVLVEVFSWINSIGQLAKTIEQASKQYVNNQILEICLAMASLDLPPYVLLEILDYIPFIGNQDHGLKINRIIQTKKSIKRVKERRFK